MGRKGRPAKASSRSYGMVYDGEALKRSLQKALLPKPRSSGSAHTEPYPVVSLKRRNSRFPAG